MRLDPGVDVAVLAGALAVFLLAGALTGRDAGERVAALLAGVTIGVLEPALLAGLGEEHTARLPTALLGAILLVTRGRPAVLFDPPSMKARAYRRLPKAERAELDRRGRETAHAQLALIVLILAGAAVAVFVEPSWLF